jgi:hypothetical protein
LTAAPKTRLAERGRYSRGLFTHAPQAAITVPSGAGSHVKVVIRRRIRAAVAATGCTTQQSANRPLPRLHVATIDDRLQPALRTLARRHGAFEELSASRRSIRDRAPQKRPADGQGAATRMGETP